MKTPLYDEHIKLGARMGPFAGWEMPIQYEGIIQEHLQTRTVASIFDTCHMGVFDVQGPKAEGDLERILTQRVASLKEGQCRYGFLLQEDGGVIDDLTVYRRGPEHFFIVVNAGTLGRDADWISSHLSSETRFQDLSPDTAKLDVQGPRAREEAEKALGHALPDLKYFHFTDGELVGVPTTISRTGYTGEWGYEFYFPTSEAVRMWELFLANPQIKPAGLGARDTLRLEVGYSLYGHELDSSQTPVPATRGMFIEMGKEFIGKEAVARDLESGVPRYLAAIELESKRAARAHDKVFSGDREVGEVTSGSLAPSVGVAVALAYLDANLCELGQPLAIDVRGKRLAAKVVDLPFYKEGTARKKLSPT